MFPKPLRNPWAGLPLPEDRYVAEIRDVASVGKLLIVEAKKARETPPYALHREAGRAGRVLLFQLSQPLTPMTIACSLLAGRALRNAIPGLGGIIRNSAIARA